MAEQMPPSSTFRAPWGTFTADGVRGMAPSSEVQDLEVGVRGRRRQIKVLDGVSFRSPRADPGDRRRVRLRQETSPRFGHHGAVAQPHGQVVAGSIRFQGRSCSSLPPDQMYKVRGNRISMIFQEPMTALNPGANGRGSADGGVRLHRPDYTRPSAATPPSPC